MEQNAIEIYDGINFITIYAIGVDNNDFIKVRAVRDDGRVWDEKTELYKDNEDNYYFVPDFISVYWDIKKVIIPNEIYETLERA